ncbi:hypothetical protein O9993_11935 [Vibrio lentus]|nr:hypothetical protein [Vibrio lentus]
MDETGSLGAAMMAMVGAGEFASLTQNVLKAITNSTSRVEPNPEHFRHVPKI